MLPQIVNDIFMRKYHSNLSKEQYVSYLEKGLSFLETNGINTKTSLPQLRAQRMALEYREAVLKNLLGID